jgi:hypothetical protein
MMRSKSFEEKASKLNFKSLIGTKYITLRDCYKGLAPFQGFMIKGTKIPYSNFYENVTFLRNLVNFCEFLSKRIMNRNAAA